MSAFVAPPLALPHSRYRRNHLFYRELNLGVLTPRQYSGAEEAP
jgi:hypothetical protein